MSLVLLKPTPTEMLRTCRDAAEAERVRHLHCTHYESCLDTAANAAWQGFHCGLCPMRSTQVEPTEHEVEEPISLHPLAGRCIPGGTTSRVWELFAEDDTWQATQLAAELGISRRQARDACRVLETQHRVRRIGPGIYERVA